MNIQLKPHSIADYIAALVLLLTLFFGFSYFWNRVKIPASPLITASEYPDYEGLNNLQPVMLISSTTSTSANKNDPKLTKYFDVKGDFSKMYFYAEVSVNNKPLTDWDSLYVKFNGVPQTLSGPASGGHLFRPKTLKVPPDDTATLLLFNTSAVPYISLPYSASKEPLFVNWFDGVFRASKKVRFDTFISTTGDGFIRILKIYYECAEATLDCYIRPAA